MNNNRETIFKTDFFHSQIYEKKQKKLSHFIKNEKKYFKDQGTFNTMRFESTEWEQQDSNREAEPVMDSQSWDQSRSSAAGYTWRSHKYLYSSVPTEGDRVKQVNVSVFVWNELNI